MPVKAQEADAADALRAWQLWRARCALALCPPAEQRALRAFAHTRFRRYAAVYARSTNAGAAAVLNPAPGDAWHWFETYLQAHPDRSGKAFKEWLFARAGQQGDPTLDCIQGGATLLLREVVREQLRREYSACWMVALEAPVGADRQGAPFTLSDLLPGEIDPVQTVANREFNELARNETEAVFAALERRERVALLARELGLSLAQPEVTRAAGCGKSVLHTAYHAALQTIAAHVRTRYPHEDRASQAALTVAVFENVRQRIVMWGKSEKGCAQLFLLVET
jgi:hypothetical protein